MPATLPRFDRARMREARRAAGVSRERVAADCDVTYRTVYRWEKPNRAEAPSLPQAVVIARLCGIDVNELVVS